MVFQADEQNAVTITHAAHRRSSNLVELRAAFKISRKNGSHVKTEWYTIHAHICSTQIQHI